MKCSFRDLVKAVFGFIWPKRDWNAEYIAWRDAPPAMLKPGDEYVSSFEAHDSLARVAFMAGVRAGREIRS